MAATIEQQVGLYGDQQWVSPSERPFIVRWATIGRKNPLGAIGFVIIVTFIVMGLIGPYITPYPPREVLVGGQFEGPSLGHPFGTDRYGQDVFSRVIAGARISLLFGVIAVFLGFIPGAILGVMSGYYGRWIDYVIQRSGEAWTAIPQLPLYLTFIAALGPGLRTIAFVVALSAIFGGSRLLRAVALIERHTDYVTAARAMGASEWQILWRHVVRNVMPYVLVGVSSIFAIAVLAEAALSFLGLGLEPGEPGWGIDLSASREWAAAEPHLVLFPGLAISFVVLGFNLLGDTLRDVLDPRLRGSR